MGFKSHNSNQLMASLVHLEGDAPLQYAAQQRQSHRCSLRGEAMLVSVEGASTEVRTLRVQLRNISRTGLGFLVSEPLPLGSIWRASFIIRNHTLGQQAMAIRHCREMAPGVHLTGAQFCIEPGLLHILGVNTLSLQSDSDDDQPDQNDYLSPGELS